jgi:hypothetical protein
MVIGIKRAIARTIVRIVNFTLAIKTMRAVVVRQRERECKGAQVSEAKNRITKC